MARTPKPRSVARAVKTAENQDAKARANRRPTQDSFVNFVQRVGRSSGNPSAGGNYALNPITRNRVELEWAYRGSWIVRAAVDAVPDDMVRAGIQLGSDLDPNESERLQRALNTNGTWRLFNRGGKWGRLYGGAIVVPIIDGQDPKEPLRVDRIRKGQYKGLVTLDRWQLSPSYNDLVTERDPDLVSTEQVGLPKYYQVMSTAQALAGKTIHYTRAWRMNGVALPWQQQLTENLWDLSIVEPLYDRLVAFDSSTQGAAQLMYRAYLRTLKLKGLVDILGQDPGSPAFTALINRVTAVRDLQVNEGFTVIDADDEVETQQYSFGGLSDIILQFGQQISGATGIPLVRLFGQSPAGLNSTGESDIRMYYDNVNLLQETMLRLPLGMAIRLTAANLGIVLPEDFWWDFTSLWEMTAEEKARTAHEGGSAIADQYERGIIDHSTALRELKQQSKTTGYFTNITDEAIEEAEQEPPQPLLGEEGLGFEEPGGEGTELGAEENAGRVDPNPFNRGESDDRSNPRHAHIHLVADSATYGFDYHGLPIFIETPAGERRRSDWPVLTADYGYIRCTGSAEGPSEGMDCFVGPNRNSLKTWVVNTIKPETEEFDEHKIMMGFDTRKAAMDCFDSAYNGAGGLERISSVRQMSIEELKQWLQTHPVSQAA